MIALQVISENKSIPNDTLIYYTKAENRKIAVLIEKGNYYKEMYSTDTAIISSQKYIIIQSNKQLYNNALQISDLKTYCTKLDNQMIKVSNENNRLNKVAKNTTIWGLSTTATTIILIIILL